MNRTQALALARAKVGNPRKVAHVHYTVGMPKSASKPDSVRIEARADTWADAQETYTMTVATITLHLLGVKRPDIEYGSDGRTIEKLVAAGLARAKG